MVDVCDVLAVGAHPDDVELGCGGLLARLSDSGMVVGIADLTAGELGTRGDAARRKAEGEEASRALHAAWRICLGLPDGGLDSHNAEQLAVIVGVLRSARPRVVLVPDAGDPHPDHRAAAGLVSRACTWSGVKSWRPERGAPHRPRLLLAYPGPRQMSMPGIAIDVSAFHAAKRAACAAHRSQFDPAAGPPTHLASGHFLAAIEGRDRAVGNTIGVEFAEGFNGLGPLPGDELVWLLATQDGGEGTGNRRRGGSPAPSSVSPEKGVER